MFLFLKNKFFFKGLDVSKELYTIIELGKQHSEDCTEEIIGVVNSIFYKMRDVLNTNLSVKQIAYELSFTDEYYFSNIFKQKVGISPGKYRKIK